jgi:protein O-mannosyl-transferase
MVYMRHAVSQNGLNWIRSHERLSFLFLSATWVLFLYWRALWNPFSSYDDLTMIVNNPGLASWHGISHYLHTNVSFVGDLRGSGESYYRPLFWISLALDSKLWGSHPFGFHLSTLLLHWINGFLFFTLLRKVRVPLEVAGCTALLWLALPINSEVVSWIAARAYCLAAFFVLVSALLAERFLVETRHAFLVPLYALAVFCALLSHEAGILALPLAMLLAYAFEKLSARPAIMLYGAALSAGLAYFGLRHFIGAHSSYSQAGSFIPFGIFYFKYLGWLTLPVHMSIERSSNTPQNNLSIQAILAWGGMLGTLGIAIFMRRKRPLIAAGLVWIWIALAPFCGLIPIYQGMAERFLYFASAGLALLVVGVCLSVTRRARPVALCIVAFWIIWSVWRLQSRVLDWADSATLYQSSLKGSPHSVKLFYNLGAVSEKRGDLVRADLSYQSVLRLQPEYEPAIAGLGNIRLRLNDPKGAADLYRQALAIKPDDAGAVTNYAASLAALGDLENAEVLYKRAITLAPGKDDAYCGLGVVLFREGNSLGAILQFMKAQRADPLDSTPYYDLGGVYQKLGKSDVAADFYKKALELSPGDTDTIAALRSLEPKR